MQAHVVLWCSIAILIDRSVTRAANHSVAHRNAI